ncbi:RNA recognition motif domain [Macleaya cordata]|uniref:RNA recognition motif domain n=1 Tax=Macleaya cordata TaxID=56857 RepID=A0A200QHK8_MACCD|nr:RNA recognition motif domain [Macleaya cordata]
MDMAEKDDTEGRCPACRTPYDKEKIVGMAANCERLVAEINSERKLKSQKAKSKTTDGRKHLSSVRVIQRNLVYIIGIPSNLADEDVLQRKEYFGQYGKVLKVSISRTAGGAIQHSSNNTCSVYITYSKEEEAVRCIQSVHGYTLDGRPLRACFGTTKYCHAWLRNMSCSNPDCLYLHDIGTQEDSFSKDEIISAYTRSRVQQITAATNNLQRRSGSVLPPPSDDFCNNDTASSAKPIPKSIPNNPAAQIKCSPPNSNSGGSVSLPAAASWGLRVSNGRPPTANSACSDGPAKQKPDGSFSSVVASSTQSSTLHTDVGKRPLVTEESHTLRLNGRVESLESSKHYIVRDCQTTVSDAPAKVVCNAASATVTSNNHLASQATLRDSEMGITMPPVDRRTCKDSEMDVKIPPVDTWTCSSASEKDGNVAANGTVHSLCSGLTSIGIDDHPGVEHCDALTLNGTVSGLHSFRSHGNQGTQQYQLEHVSDPLTSSSSRKIATSDAVSVSREQSDWRLESPTQVLPDVCSEVEEESPAFDERNLKVAEVTHPSLLPNLSNSLRASNHYSGHSLQHGDTCSTSSLGNNIPGTVHAKVDEVSPPFGYSDFLASSGLNNNKVGSSELGNSFKWSNFSSNMEEGKYLGRFNDHAAFADRNAAVDMGESSIITGILSLDNDAWDDSLTSPHNLARLFSETDKQHGSLKISSSWKGQNSNQSRFSFARQEDVVNQGSNVEPSFSSIGQMTNKYPDFQDFPENRDPYLDRLRNGFSSSILEEPETFPSSQFSISSDRLSVSRAQISAPPGFSLPSRPPPPGFSSQERMDQTFDNISGHHLVESSSMLRNHYPPQPTNIIEDPEFNDPAILAVVGKGGRWQNGMNGLGLDMRSTFTPQLSANPETDPRLQLLMQQSLSSHQNLIFSDHMGDRFSSMADAYRTPSRFPEQSQIPNPSPYGQLSFHQSRNAHLSNGHWDGWNEVQNGNELVMAELLRNERLGGFNKHFPGYEDLKYRMPSSGDIYNRAFGM